MADTLFSWGSPMSWGSPFSWGSPQSWGRAQSWGSPAAVPDPAVASGLTTTRDALLATLDGEARRRLANAGIVQRWQPSYDGLPEQNRAVTLDRQGADIRATLVQFELLGGLQFKAEPAAEGGGWARLSTASGDLMLEVRRPARDRFLAELDRVQALAALRTSRAAEVLSQTSPPYAYYASVLNLQSGKHANTMELVQACVSFASAVGQRFKLALAVPRPSEYSGQIQPMIEVPQHAAFPAGHALEAYVTAGILSALVGASRQQSDMLRALAFRIAENRVVAGVHFPVDCQFGRLIGDSLTSYLLAGCGVTPSWRGASFDGRSLSAGGELDFMASPAPFDDDQAGKPLVHSTAPALPLLARLWQRARGDWFEADPGPGLGTNTGTSPVQASAT